VIPGAAKGPGGQLKEALGVLLFLVLLVALWQLVVVALDVPAYLLPPPLDVANAFVDSWRILLENLLVTLEEIVLGLGAGVLLGLATAVLMHQSAVLGKALYVPILATQTTPVVAVAPILIVWFGVGILPKVMIIAIFSFFPVLVNTLSGLQATGRQMIHLMETVAASQWQIYRHVRIPMALPHVFAGIRLAAAASVVGAIVVAAERLQGFCHPDRPAAAGPAHLLSVRLDRPPLLLAAAAGHRIAAMRKRARQ
jgi:ABC-type nitrate/sulfonate/bicarbonate transport system permease component